MGRTRVTDMSAEFAREAGAEARPAALVRYLGRIVAAATATHPGITIESAIRCRRRPGHRPCAGYILVRRQELPPEIQWGCPACHDRGLIHNWRGTPYDVSRPSRFGEEELEVVVAEEAYRLLEGSPLLDAASDRIIQGGRRHRRGILLAGRPLELDILLDDVSAVANGERRRDRQILLDRVADRIESALRRWRR